MAGVTDTQQHSGHRQHPGPLLAARGGWAMDGALGVCIVNSYRGLHTHSQICI